MGGAGATTAMAVLSPVVTRFEPSKAGPRRSSTSLVQFDYVPVRTPHGMHALKSSRLSSAGALSR